MHARVQRTQELCVPPAGCVSPAWPLVGACASALCLPALRHPSTLLLLREPVSPLSASPVFRGLLPPGASQIQKGRLNPFSVHKDTAVSRRILGPGVSPPCLPTQVCLGHSSGEPPLPCSRAKASPSPQCPWGSSAGVRKFSLAVWALALGLWIRRH